MTIAISTPDSIWRPRENSNMSATGKTNGLSNAVSFKVKKLSVVTSTTTLSLGVSKHDVTSCQCTLVLVWDESCMHYIYMQPLV